MSTRQEARSDGRTVIKRIMPRQNEMVNEIWLCDKGRFVHHFTDSPQRITTPLIRENGQLVETSWDDALDLVAGRLQMNKPAIAGLANDRLSNEDLFMFQKLFREGLENNNIDINNRRLGGGDVVARVGLTSGSNLLELDAGDAILVVATDLHEEAPIWWLRVKQAAERGVSVVVLNMRPTRLDKYATLLTHYDPSQALNSVHQLLNAAKVDVQKEDGNPLQAAADLLVEAGNLVVFYGGEGLSFEDSDTLARMLGNLLLVKQMNGDDHALHAGRTNNGLIPVWPHGNTQGALDMGVRPDFGPGYAPLAEPGLDAAAIYAGVANGEVKSLFLVGADPVGDGLMEDRGQLDFLIVQELFLTESAKLADIVLPAQSWAEREGSYTSGERRVQRFYPAITTVGESRPDWHILAQIGERVGSGKPPFAASLVFRVISQSVPQYATLDYRNLAWSQEQWPIVGGDDLYYGGTSYRNESGLGRQWPTAAESADIEQFEVPEIDQTRPDGLALISTPALYAAGTLLSQSEIMAPRVAQSVIFLNAQDAEQLAIVDGEAVSIMVEGAPVAAQAHVNGRTPAGVALLHGAGKKGAWAPAVITKNQ